MELSRQKNSPQTIIISAINIRSGGPLTILKNCLNEISKSDLCKKYKVIALVFNKENCHFANIEYIEFPHAKSRIYSYYMEYFGFKKLSKNWNSALWISLTDKTPFVHAQKMAVYLHNPTPFFRVTWKDFIYSPFLLLYVLFYKKVCAINIHKNDHIIVQQSWLRDSYSKLFEYPKNKCIVFPPLEKVKPNPIYSLPLLIENKTFIFASLPRGFKNFEIICDANQILIDKGIKSHKILLTMKGDESRYARSIFLKYNKMKNISFVGVVPKEELFQLYEKSDCLIFPSRLETWGLPISEFSVYNKPMLLANLPYAHNTAAGSKKAAFFDPYNPIRLAIMMERIIKNDYSFLHEVVLPKIEKPVAKSWEETINIILNE